MKMTSKTTIVDNLIEQLPPTEKTAINKIIANVVSTINFNDIKIKMLDSLQLADFYEKQKEPNSIYNALMESVKVKLLDDFNKFDKYQADIEESDLQINDNGVDSTILLATDIVYYMESVNKELASKYLSLDFIRYKY